MSRVNHRDTLLTDLRELQRRLRLLEAAKVAAKPAAALALPPTRPVDWPATTSPDWEDLFDATTRGGVLELRWTAEEGTTGSVRVLLDGSQVGGELTAGAERGTDTVPIAGGAVSVQARRTSGTGLVRVAVFLTA
ncbi:hypothetical protein [Kutzneria albida]|uniref:Uncharacterized protein n=1 Tax=Kutzneria albida DSM 43870 TaxID=1449976 RepID=W5W917_9PSEU|nr:hypothetical protein [Kutzneria albida]AHH97230.1 hypothetical protein KALB_3866 [Kutzneria albida DSM 43870]